MSRVRSLTDEQDEDVRAAANLMGICLGATVLGVIAQDERGVFLLPHPGLVLAVFDYLASVDWARQRLIASEHYTSE